MKIGIITYHRPHNYGALLQAYSLKTYIGKLGNNVEIVDYWPLYHSVVYGLFYNFSKLKFVSKIKKLVLMALGFIKILKRRNGYSSFLKNYLGLNRNPLYLAQDSLKNLNFDTLVYGSDQIWRKQNYPLFKGFDDAYFGEHVLAKKKIAYAASMGAVDIDEQDSLFLKAKLTNFNFLAVREAGLKKAISGLTEKSVTLVLDPVFLIDKTEWQKLIPIRKTREKYILLFQLLTYRDSVVLTERIASSFGLNVIEIPGTNVNPLLWGARYKQTESPLGFLALVNNASFIVSTSFHAVAFSILFEKQFYAIGLNNNSDRVESLLKSLGIGRRYLNKLDDADCGDLIDYSEVNTLLQPQIEYSRNYLTKALLDISDCP